jgi:hypothetical protein
MDVFEGHLSEFDLGVKLDKGHLCIHTSLRCLPFGQRHQNRAIIDPYHKITQRKWGKKFVFQSLRRAGEKIYERCS